MTKPGLLVLATVLPVLAACPPPTEPARDARPNYERIVSLAPNLTELISLCGGRNVFADLEELAPAIDVEAVVARDPEVLLASTDAGEDAFAEWQRWPAMAANRYDNHYLVPADEIGRATPRLLVAARAVCAALEQARARREMAATGGRSPGR